MKKLNNSYSLYKFDKEIKTRYPFLCGVDEAGRGSLFGCVTSACVILKDDFFCEEINDSKKLNEKKREYLYNVIIENSIDYNIVSINNYVIDEINILNATKLCMKKAIEGLKTKCDLVLIDGNFVPKIKNINCEFLIKGDQKSFSIACASILAKVTRDRIMYNLSNVYKDFNLKNHKGYATKQHYLEIEKFGITSLHRQTFLKKIKK